ncbi:hypothetical protein HMF7854_10600 [Sphingomonas ginkgonis]|uniref:Peptidase M15A C-terminal domain-containing protein n=1 Tax=Sphingomonas ginkgonis TaxID=2315330 RepID=A0A429VBB6_9SPHN|nr:D-Ala-D-Ala carboxypeptidase family metallohydrolase [Sphingomonas ginkgonis]RST31234.1 hypothetical protein HMF7854_10600 [Sphingomonas ginkgonis]
MGIGGLVLLAAVGAATSAQATDFGIRVPGRLPPAVSVDGIRSTPLLAEPASPRDPARDGASPASASGFKLQAAASVGARWGRVTSTFRSPEHNRAVGGVPNSWHMHGRAIDIARRAGVTHAMIAAAFRTAGYRLIESLDEGDHSHFAFAVGGSNPSPLLQPTSPELTRWGIVTVAAVALR